MKFIRLLIKLILCITLLQSCYSDTHHEDKDALIDLLKSNKPLNNEIHNYINDYVKPWREDIAIIIKYSNYTDYEIFKITHELNINSFVELEYIFFIEIDHRVVLFQDGNDKYSFLKKKVDNDIISKAFPIQYESSRINGKIIIPWYNFTVNETTLKIKDNILISKKN